MHVRFLIFHRLKYYLIYFHRMVILHLKLFFQYLIYFGLGLFQVDLLVLDFHSIVYLFLIEVILLFYLNLNHQFFYFLLEHLIDHSIVQIKEFIFLL